MSIPELDPDLTRVTPNEWTTVERPLLVQLAAMGWDYLQGDLDYPQKTHRETFRKVLLLEPLRQAVRIINAAENVDEITIIWADREAVGIGGTAQERRRTITTRLMFENCKEIGC